MDKQISIQLDLISLMIADCTKLMVKFVNSADDDERLKLKKKIDTLKNKINKQNVVLKELEQGIVKIKNERGAGRHFSKTPEQIELIVKRVANGEKTRLLAEEFDVTIKTVQRYVRDSKKMLDENSRK